MLGYKNYCMVYLRSKSKYLIVFHKLRLNYYSSKLNLLFGPQSSLPSYINNFFKPTIYIYKKKKFKEETMDIPFAQVLVSI